MYETDNVTFEYFITKKSKIIISINYRTVPGTI